MDDWPVTVYVFEKEPFLGLENDDIPLEIKLIMWYQSLVVIILYIYILKAYLCQIIVVITYLPSSRFESGKLWFCARENFKSPNKSGTTAEPKGERIFWGGSINGGTPKS